jgi:hypothetical protein
MSPAEKKVSSTNPPILVPADAADLSGSDTEYDSDEEEIQVWLVNVTITIFRRF